MKQFILLILLARIGPSFAQAPPEEPPPTFRILSACGSYGGLYYDADFYGTLKSMPIILNQSLSSPQAWPVDGKLVIYRLIPPPAGAPPETLPTRQTVMQSDLSKDNVTTIVVTFPSTNDRRGPLRAYLVPDTAKKHKAGTIKIINFSSHQAMVALDEKSKQLASGEIDTMKTDEGRVLVRVGVNKGQGWQVAFRGERRIAPQLRGYVFVFNYMVDPDYGEDPTPPPALAKIFFEVSAYATETP